MNTELFITSHKFKTLERTISTGPNGSLLFVACNSGIDFANSVKKEYEKMLKLTKSIYSEVPIIGTHESPVTNIFSDTETRPRLSAHVAGSDVFVFQSVHENLSGNSVNENIQQLLQVVRTIKAHRAQTITVLTPYSPYSRQDKPTFMKREAALASLFADQLKIAGADVYLTYHAHTIGLCGFYEPEIKFVALSGLYLFLKIFEKFKERRDVAVISTDAGGAKFAIRLSEILKITYAISSKFRRKKDDSNLIGIIGDLEDKKIAIITDDETVTGKSILNTVKSIYEDHGIKETYVAVSHLKVRKEYFDGFVEAFEKYGLKELHITDTIPQIPELLKLDFVKMHSITGIMASTINRLHFNRSITEYFIEENV
ncbi:MAG: ribose-phosphate pyrophosphokinase [Bacteriovoracaceae bacterium]|nr:ribose-phosphate pyrophosphokinase [Bacteriovoracaceae bacterium]